MLQKLRGNNSKGFTLIELMIVIAIIGILAAIAIPNFIAYRDKAYCGQAEHDAQNTLAAISSWYSEPENIAVPGVQTLIDSADLSLNNPVANVAIATAAGDIQVTVTDSTARCPRSTTYVATMGGATGSWN